MGDDTENDGQPVYEQRRLRPKEPLTPLTEWRMPSAPAQPAAPQRPTILPRALHRRTGTLVAVGLGLVVVIAGATLFLSKPDIGDLVAGTPVSEKRLPEKRNVTPPRSYEPVALPSGMTLERDASLLNYDLAAWLATTPASSRTFAFERLHFDAGSAVVSETDKPMLQVLSQILTAYPQARVTIIGNGPGTLAIERANAIRDVLLQLAADAAQLSTAAGDSSENPPKLTVKLEMGVGSDLDA
jgi:flagellar motor protein MotB